MDPLVFEPILKQTIWGGRRLGELLGKPIGEANDYAESWEIVDRTDAQSLISSPPIWGGGEHRPAGGNAPAVGTSLRQLMQQHSRPLLGRHGGQHERFPLLVKFLDCHQVLSVQVHPDDRYAQAMPQPDLGKTEVWYVVEAAAGAKLYAGLKPDVGPRELRQAIQWGRTEETLHVVRPQVGQCLFIPAGTVHALGGGLVVAEIQQSSDTTFRLYDWDRLDHDGNSRPLHIEQALAVTDFSAGPVQPQAAVSLGDGREQLVDCDYFLLQQIRWGSSVQANHAVNLPAEDRLVIAVVVAGQVVLETDSGYRLTAARGQTVLIPAAATGVRLSGTEASTVLLAMLP